MKAEIEMSFESRHRLTREIIETLVLTILMFLIIRMAVQNFNIDGMSMEPSLHNRQLVLVDKWSYFFHKPARGDIVVFNAPPNPSQDYIKRIIAVPGDVVSIENTTVIVNGEVLKETYLDDNRQGNPYPSFSNRVIPPDTYFVLGDNRAGSSDSRDWGCVPEGNIIGRAAVVYWPLGQDNNGLLPNVGAVFENVPAPSQEMTSSSTVCPVIQNPVTARNSSSEKLPELQLAMVLVLPTMVVWLHTRFHRPSHQKR